MDQLRNALQSALGVPAPAATPPAEEGPSLPDPLKSEWVALLRQLGGEVPANATMGQLTQRSAARARALAEGGRKREAAALERAREEFERDRAKRAWALVKDRFAELELPEKTYRSMKQEEVDPVKLLARVTNRKSEQLKGLGAARLREELLKG